MLSSENNVVIGLQWGFEGKKRITDFFANRSETIVRFNGSSSGGHAIYAGGEEFVLNYLPCGIHHDGKFCAVASGVVLDLERLSNEIYRLKEAGVLKARLVISGRCPLILDYHKKMDVLENRFCGRQASLIMRDTGYSQAVSDVERGFGIKAADLLDIGRLKTKLDTVIKIKNAELSAIFNEKPIDTEELLAKMIMEAKMILPYIGEVEDDIRKSIEENSGVLFEGCDGSMCDVVSGRDTGAHTAAALFVSTGIRHNCSLRVIGAAKAYSVRGGASGTFITEEKSAVGAFLRARGSEYDEITNEPRRTGWLDLPALAYSAKKNCADMLALTKLDVLTGIDVIKVCTSYILDGREITRGCLTDEEASRAQPVYAELEGWKEDIQSCPGLGKLPRQAQDYIRLVEEYTGLRVIWAGLGREWGNALYDPGYR